MNFPVIQVQRFESRLAGEELCLRHLSIIGDMAFIRYYCLIPVHVRVMVLVFIKTPQEMLINFLNFPSPHLKIKISKALEISLPFPCFYLELILIKISRSVGGICYLLPYFFSKQSFNPHLLSFVLCNCVQLTAMFKY